jgi:hypothetical protein
MKCGRNREVYDRAVYERLGKRVNWLRGGNWLNYEGGGFYAVEPPFSRNLSSILVLILGLKLKGTVNSRLLAIAFPPSYDASLVFVLIDIKSWFNPLSTSTH